jgi:low temperature requirement protein LtrA
VDSLTSAAGPEAELFWDLVFVFAITQVTALLSGDLTWRGFGRSMLVLALVWGAPRVHH